MPDDARFDAVADNFIYIHRALCHDLSGIREGGVLAFRSDFPRFARILDKHTELEEQLFFPALELRAPGSVDVTRAPHREIEEQARGLEARVGDVDASESRILEDLKAFEETLGEHLAEEQRVVMPEMMRHFSAEELWALDARIMEFCSPEFMQEMMPWWFLHMNADDRVAVARNMLGGVDASVLPALCQWISDGLAAEEWKQLAERVPELLQSSPAS